MLGDPARALPVTRLRRAPRRPVQAPTSPGGTGSTQRPAAQMDEPGGKPIQILCGAGQHGAGLRHARRRTRHRDPLRCPARARHLRQHRQHRSRYRRGQDKNDHRIRQISRRAAQRIAPGSARAGADDAGSWRSSDWSAACSSPSLLVYLLIVVNFQSWLDPFIIIAALPGGAGRDRVDAVPHWNAHQRSGADRLHHVHGRGYGKFDPGGFLRPRATEDL